MSQKYTLTFAPADLTEEDLIAKLKDTVVYILGGDEKVTAAVLESDEARDLRLIVFLGVQPETFFTPEALKLLDVKNIKLASTPAANSNAVAEMTIALMLAQYRRIPDLATAVHRLGWPQLQANELEGKIFGIIGMGKIGYLVGKKARALEMKIIYTSRRRVEAAEVDLGARLVEKDKLLREADVISLHLPLTPETERYISERELKLMKPSAILINTARAWLVDPEALRQALTEGRIAGAVFDGYYLEGVELAEGDPFGLLELPIGKFLCTPHQAFNTGEANQKASKIAQNIIIDFFSAAPGAGLGKAAI